MIYWYALNTQSHRLCPYLTAPVSIQTMSFQLIKTKIVEFEESTFQIGSRKQSLMYRTSCIRNEKTFDFLEFRGGPILDKTNLPTRMKVEDVGLGEVVNAHCFPETTRTLHNKSVNTTKITDNNTLRRITASFHVK